MAKRITVKSFEEFQSTVAPLKDEKHLLCLFTGSEDASGKSWCPDCVAAKPAIEEALKDGPDNTILLTCSIDKDLWVKRDNPFRTDNTLKLTCVPTLIRWGWNRRLNDQECQDAGLVSMMLED
ncbi:thioredoxin domain-containing protein 17 [Ixodes scapularis]|uniref:thioredoxin domain-containing protein 17 n=1 Tax=Ixodes scapularis TaxID=6945 RepID=UPI001C386322|nr:thioredoxin domain-containing protein 17 [Ixodes scapularis]